MLLKQLVVTTRSNPPSSFLLGKKKRKRKRNNLKKIESKKGGLGFRDQVLVRSKKKVIGVVAIFQQIRL